MTIVSEATGEATIDGTDASVVYTLAAIERIETRCGAAVMALIERGQHMALTMVEVRAILQAGMEAHRRRSEVKGPAVTDAQAAEVMAAAGMMSAMLTCLDSLARSNELGLVTMPGVSEAMAEAEGMAGGVDPTTPGP